MKRAVSMFVPALLAAAALTAPAVTLPPDAFLLRYQGFESGANDTWAYTATAGATTTTMRQYAGASSLAMNSTTGLSITVTFTNISLTPHRNVFLSIAFSASGPDANDDLFLDLSYDNGSTWTGTGSVKLVDGFNNAQVPFGGTSFSEPATVSTNPWTVALPVGTSQVSARVRFATTSGSSAVDSYYIDDLALYAFPSNLPPHFAPLTDQVAFVVQTLEFPVIARDYDGDTITLSASNLPPNSTWSNAVGSGIVTQRFTFTPLMYYVGNVFTTHFYAVDNDGVRTQTVRIAVDNLQASLTPARETFPETGGTQSVWVSISRSASVLVRVQTEGVALPGVDYTLPAVTGVQFQAGGPTTLPLPIGVLDDPRVEGPESITLSLAPAEGLTLASNRCDVTIEDDETFTLATANLSAGFIYRDASSRMLRALAPDIVAMQEFSVTNAGGLREFVDLTFGTNYVYFVESNTLPDGVVSRWPILAAGTWVNSHTPNRRHVWATIDLPGPRNLNVVSVHLAFGSVLNRTAEILELVQAVTNAGFSTNDYLAVCGDFNFSSFPLHDLYPELGALVRDTEMPTDQVGNPCSNGPRHERYDYVLADPELDARTWPLAFGGYLFPDGIVFDTRQWTSWPPPYPALVTDSGFPGLQHMAVMKVFGVREPLRIRTTATGHGRVTPPVAKLNPGDSATFAIIPDRYYDLTGLWTNASPVPVPDPAGGSLLWSNVVADGELEALFDQRITARETPEWWLGQHGWTNDFATADELDHDGDGARNWEEWQAGTSPLNGDSRLAITNVESGPAMRITFSSVSPRVYTLETRSALGTDDWVTVPGQVDVPGEAWSMSLVDTNPVPHAFYRIGVRIP